VKSFIICFIHENLDVKNIDFDNVNWIKLAHDTVIWQALVNMVIKLRIPEREGNYLVK
jgi:hypothetical protein